MFFLENNCTFAITPWNPERKKCNCSAIVVQFGAIPLKKVWCAENQIVRKQSKMPPEKPKKIMQKKYLSIPFLQISKKCHKMP